MHLLVGGAVMLNEHNNQQQSLSLEEIEVIASRINEILHTLEGDLYSATVNEVSVEEKTELLDLMEQLFAGLQSIRIKSYQLQQSLSSALWKFHVANRKKNWVTGQFISFAVRTYPNPLGCFTQHHKILHDYFNNKAAEALALFHVPEMPYAIVNRMVVDTLEYQNVDHQDVVAAYKRHLAEFPANEKHYEDSVVEEIDKQREKFIKLAFQHYKQFYPDIANEKAVAKTLKLNLDQALQKHIGNAFLQYPFRTMFYHAMEKLGENQKKFSPTTIASIIKDVSAAEKKINTCIAAAIGHVNERLAKEYKTSLLAITKEKMQLAVASLVAKLYPDVEITPAMQLKLGEQIESFIIRSTPSKKVPFDLFGKKPETEIVMKDFDVIVAVGTDEERKIKVTQEDVSRWLREIVQENRLTLGK